MIFTYVLGYFWVYVLLYAVGVIALVSVLVAVLIVHVWLDSTESKAKEKVRKHRESMLLMKKELLELREKVREPDGSGGETGGGAARPSGGGGRKRK